MNAAKILHDTAMDFFDLAKIAKAKGNIQSHNEYMEKALVIEKEAALKLPEDAHGDFWPYAYLRSAAWMAFHLEHYDEAKSLTQLALSGKPSAFEKERLNEVLNAIKPLSKTNGENITYQTLTGFLISIDLSQQQLVVQISNTEYKNLTLPKQLHIAPFLLGHMVTIQLVDSEVDSPIIKDIRLAA